MIGNIERVSNLFLTKTVYSVLLAVLVGLAGLSAKIFGTDPLLFPFQPIHVTIAAWFTIGVPAFVAAVITAAALVAAGPLIRILGDRQRLEHLGHRVRLCCDGERRPPRLAFGLDADLRRGGSDELRSPDEAIFAKPRSISSRVSSPLLTPRVKASTFSRRSNSTGR